jgi:DNA-binding response OmpR family regulator
MKLLIVEDDEKIVEFLKKYLEKEYFCIDTTDNGNDAIYLSEINNYDVILLDIMIFGVGGEDVCKTLRKKQIDTPIIILSAKNTIADKVNFLNIGANDYLAKPFSFEELLARIKVQLRAKNQLNNILEIGDLRLDTSSKIVKRADDIINLTAKEYMILEVLMRNKNKIIDENILIDKLQNIEQTFNSNALNVYIYRLRNKIDKKYEMQLIKTVRNLGFKITDENI